MALDAVDGELLAEDDRAVWELFHENSKTSRYERHLVYPVHPSDATVVQAMRRLRTTKQYTDRRRLPLPRSFPKATKDLEQTLLDRTSARAFSDGSVSLEVLAKVLFMSYGVTRDNADTHFPRPFRVIPSGGALYPLELYVRSARIEGLGPGLYHYDPEEHSLDVLSSEVDADARDLFVQGDLAAGAAAIVFVSALFRRSTFKYGDRGYRFVLLEAGHLAQNAMLTAGGLDLLAVPIGGYFDRDVDRYLGFDGLGESVIYVILLGQGRPAGGAAGDQTEGWSEEWRTSRL